MGKKLYVGNLAYGVTDSALQAMFAPHGTVQSAQVIMDRDTGRSKGFGFVEMSTENAPPSASLADFTQTIEELRRNGEDVEQLLRKIEAPRANTAHSRPGSADPGL